jgi:hypothetical protein
MTMPLKDWQILVGFAATSPPPTGCKMGARFSMTEETDGRISGGRAWQIGREMTDMRPALFSVVPLVKDKPDPGPDDVALWDKLAPPPASAQSTAPAQSSGAKP